MHEIALEQGGGDLVVGVQGMPKLDTDFQSGLFLSDSASTNSEGTRPPRLDAPKKQKDKSNEDMEENVHSKKSPCSLPRLSLQGVARV